MTRALIRRMDKLEQSMVVTAEAETGKGHFIVVDPEEDPAHKIAALRTSPEWEEGDRFIARDAVVSTIHVKHLLDMAPREVWGEDFEYGVDTFDVGVPCSATYLATTVAPEFDTPDGPRSAVSAGLARQSGTATVALATFSGTTSTRTGRFSLTTIWRTLSPAQWARSALPSRSRRLASRGWRLGPTRKRYSAG